MDTKQFFSGTANTHGEFGGKFYWRPDLTRRIPGHTIWKEAISGNWDNFLAVCVLAGTDYNAGVTNVGVKTARQLVTKYGSLKAVVATIDDRLGHKYKLPHGFLESAERAILMFKHALIFDNGRSCVCHCEPPPEVLGTLINVGEENWIGRMPISQEESIKIARSEVNPDTLEIYAESIETDVTVEDESQPRRSARRLHSRPARFRNAHDAPASTSTPAHEFSAVDWKNLLSEFGVQFPVPQTTDIPQTVLNKLLQPTESDVERFTGLFSEYRLDPVETLKHFRGLRQRNDIRWDLKMLQAWCRTRRIGYCSGPRSKQLAIDPLLALCEKQVLV